jgi:hypothetical protein
MWIKQLREHLQQHSPEVMCLKEAELGFHLSQIIEQTVRILPILCDLSIVVELNGSSPGIRALFFWAQNHKHRSPTIVSAEDM